MKTKTKIILAALIGLTAVTGVGGYIIVRNFQHEEANQNVKMENKLLIGTYEKSYTTDKFESTNTLKIEVYNNKECVQKYDLRSNNALLISDVNYPNCVFFDMSDIMKQYTNGIGINLWNRSNPSKNYISVRVQFDSAPFLSGEVKVTDCGLYLINVPTKNDEIPQVAHCYYYQNNTYGWW